MHEGRQPRKTGVASKRGLSKEQRPVLTAVARGGETRAFAEVSATEINLLKWMNTWLKDRDIIMVSDAHCSNLAAVSPFKCQHEVLNRSKGERQRGSFHLQTVNQRHSTMKRCLNHHHRGVSTRYLNNYLHWFETSEFRIDKNRPPGFIRI